MKTFISALCLFCLTAGAADVKVSDLPAATNPSTNTFLLISDMNAVTKSQKFLATNYVRQSQIDTSAKVQAIIGQVYQATNATLTDLSGATPTINGDLNVTGTITNLTTQTDTLYLSSLTETNKVIGIGATTNAMVATAGMVTNTLGIDFDATLALKAPLASPTFSGTVTIPTAAVATQTLGTGTVTNNIGAKITVGDTTFVDLSKASQTNDASGGTITLAHATNGIANVHLNHVRWVFASADTTLTFGTGAALWRTNVYSAVPPKFTNGTITKIVLESWHETDTSAKQTNCFVSFEYFK